ncbi:MAG: S-layer homology domain-containing protein [Syntrophomonadaceae bacterium]|jgi:hypothetical protein
MRRVLLLAFLISFSVIAAFIFPANASAALVIPITNLEVLPSNQSADVGETVTYKAMSTNAAGKVTDVTNLCDWFIGDSTIAQNISPGEFKALKAGTTIVWAKWERFPEGSNEAGLTVTEPQGKPILVIEPANASILKGESQQYRAYLRNTLGDAPNLDVTDACVWEINNPIAELQDQGLFQGIAIGNAIVTAHYYKASPVATHYVPPLDLLARATLEVKDKTTRYWLEVTPPTATIMVGESRQYTATLYSSDNAAGDDVTSICSWAIAENIANPVAKGKYQGTSEGTTTVTATYNPVQEAINGESSIMELSDDAVLIVLENEIPPPTENLPDGKMIDRQPGYITLCDPQNLGNPGNEFFIDFDQSKMDTNPDRYPKAFYWNTSYQKWVALTTYPVANGKVKVLNDGNYSGWFVVMGCIQPNFTDIGGHWAEKIANRMNGLGLLEGYPDPQNPNSLTRPAGLDRIIIRSELTAAVSRILGLAPGDTHLYSSITYMTAAENDQILQAKYSDADQIPEWARPYVAAMTKAGLVSGKGDRFAPNDQLTRIEAAVIISNALKNVPGFGTPADLSTYSDYSQVPGWAVGKVAQGTINGYPDGTLRPNQTINRAESLTLLLTLLRGLDW